MIRFFRVFPDIVQALIQAIEGVARLLSEVLAAVREHGDVVDRVNALEQRESLWQAEVEARLIKSESTLKAARAAEERARVLSKKAADAQGLDEGGENGSDPVAQFLAAVQAHHAAGSSPEGMQPMRESVAPRSGKAASRAAKFGVNHG